MSYQEEIDNIITQLKLCIGYILTMPYISLKEDICYETLVKKACSKFTICFYADINGEVYKEDMIINAFLDESFHVRPERYGMLLQFKSIEKLLKFIEDRYDISFVTNCWGLFDKCITD